MFEDLKQEIVEHFSHRLSEAFAQLDAQQIAAQAADKEAMIAALMPTIIATYSDNIDLIEQACGFTTDRRAQA